MKKNYILLALLTIIIASTANAQAPIVVQNGSNTRFFQSVPTAVSAASIGDTIYIPGGSWDVGGLSISKTLHIIGTGHTPPDSTNVNEICYLTGGITLTTGASYGSITGIQLTGGLYVDGAAEAIVNYALTRNRIDNSADFGANFSYGLFVENVFTGNFNVTGPSNCSYNNIFAGTVYFANSGNILKNNLFMKSGQSTNCHFENNIFFAVNHYSLGVYNNIFNNNLIIPNITFPYGSNIGSNNIVNQDQTTIFVNQTGNTFNYGHDYHLQATSPGNNAGTDGTDIGIYGGIYPWKEGSVPAIPQILSKKIGYNTDQNGNLQINIKVEAQDR